MRRVHRKNSRGLNVRRNKIIQVVAGLPAIVWVLLGAGCNSVGPDYKPPEMAMPAAWTTSLENGSETAAANTNVLQRWWGVFHDPVLSELIERARAGNLDLRQAEARVRQARAQRGMAKADLFPVIGGNASASRSRSSEEAGSGSTSVFYSAGFDASWELDIFGEKRRALESATASQQAAEESFRDVLISLFAEVAVNYVEARSCQQLISITESNVLTRSETHDITRWRREAGLTTTLDEDQARMSLEQARAQVPLLSTRLEQAKYRLALLLGQHPGALKPLMTEARPVPSAPVEAAVGLPAELLRRRPDIRNAERLLAAQTAQIGVARAALYPKFSLLGSVGLESLEFGNLFTAGARTARGAAQSAWTLFQGGGIRRNIELQTARQEEALSFYEQTVLAALNDVENSLVACVNEQARQRSLEQAVVAGQSAFALARDEYSSGIADFQVVLDTQQSLLIIQDQLAASQANAASHLISLYKSLGGGWSADTPGSAAPESPPQNDR